MWHVLEDYGLEGKLLGAVRAFYEKSEACVRIGKKYVRLFSNYKRCKARLCDVTVDSTRDTSNSKMLTKGCMWDLDHIRI